MSGLKPFNLEAEGLYGRTVIQDLVQLALGGLRQMYHIDRHSFCYGTERGKDSLANFGLSRTNTLIAMIGIRKAEIAGYQPPIEMAPALKSLAESVSSLDTIGNVGLYLWLSSMYSASVNPLQSSGIELGSVLTRFMDAREHRTMELAWFLAGLSEFAGNSNSSKKELELLAELATETYLLLRGNQEASGLFRHSSSRHSISGRLRSRIASFADQIYPIFALARFSVVFGVESGVLSALSCAERVCNLQGPLGQWWWHYDAVDGRVVGRYPVYSVHQDGMAPMAFLALSRASGRSFSGPLFKGLNWIYGNNELAADLRDERHSVIWRNIHQSKLERYIEEGRLFLFPSARAAPASRLEILFECHPYHLGWILFAFADPDR